MCHFIDLMRFLAGSPIVSVRARRMGDAPGVAVIENRALGIPSAEVSLLPAAELLSIAVDPACQGRGIAADLYAGLKIFFATRGQGAFKIIVGAPLAPAHRFHRRMGAEPVAEIEVHRGAASTVYVQRVGDV